METLTGILIGLAIGIAVMKMWDTLFTVTLPEPAAKAKQQARKQRTRQPKTPSMKEPDVAKVDPSKLNGQHKPPVRQTAPMPWEQ